MLKSADVSCEVTYYRNLLVILACFVRFLEGIFLRKSLAKSEGVTDFSQKNSKNNLTY